MGITGRKAEELFDSPVIITSPTGAVAKYCDEHVCVSVYPQGYLSNHIHDISKFFMHVAYGRGLVLLQEVTKSQGEWAILGENVPDKHDIPNNCD